jgi:hypothetical protein
MSDGSHEAALLELVDVTRQRLVAIDRRHAPSIANRFAHSLIECVYASILAVTTVVWTMLGFVLWVPLLVRNTVLLAGTVFYASLYRDNAKVMDAQDQVKFATRFYVLGFEHFLAFYRQRREPEQPVGLLEPLRTMTRGDFVVEGAWVVTVWGAIWRLTWFI